MKRITIATAKKFPTEADAIIGRGEYNRGISVMMQGFNFDFVPSEDNRGGSYTDAGGTLVQHYSQLSGETHRNMFTIDSALDSELTEISTAIRDYSTDLEYRIVGRKA